jgi:predicted peptidase
MKKTRFVGCIGILAVTIACTSTGGNVESSMAAPVVTAPVLNELKVLVTFGGATAMIPSFAPDIFNYSLSVQSDISTVGILPASDPAARYTIQVNDMDLIAGITSKVDLAVGDNTIKVAVADTHHATRVYMLHVSRENIQPVASKFLKAGFSDTATGIAMSYRLFVPDSYDPARFYPLLLFLHGAGERGSDNEIQLLANQGATVWAKPEQQSRHSCFVLAPQCPWDPSADSARAPYGKGGWTSLIPNGFTDPYKARPELETAFDILQSVSRTYSIDKKRIYCTGLSMGGFGTWAIAISHPDTFAALVVIAGGGDPAQVATVASIPSWIFHAVRDPIVSIRFAEITLQALTSVVGRTKYTEYSEDLYFYPAAHLSWIPAYANAAMREWLFQQSR